MPTKTLPPESKANIVHDPRFEQIAAQKKKDERVKALCLAWCEEFGLHPSRWEGFTIDARKAIVAADHLKGRSSG